MDFPGGSDSKASVYNTGDPGSIPWWGRSPGEGNGNPLQLPRKPHGQRSLAGYSPWGRKESDITERLYFQTTCWVWIRTKLVGQLWGIIHYTGQVLAGSCNFTILQRSLQVLAFLKFSLSIDFYHLFHMMENHLEGPPSRGLRAGLVLIVYNLIGSFLLEILIMKPMERERKRISKSLKT